MLSARFHPLSRSRAFRSKWHADVTSPAHKRCLFQNSSFCWSRKELENFEFFQNSKLSQVEREHISPCGRNIFLSSEEIYSFERETCIHSFGRRVLLRTGDIYSPNWCACPTRVGVQVPLDRVGRSDPSGSV